jgi:DNA (cytosine-5)-methyltransferase 1
MPAAAYYNEIDPYAAEWLRNLIAGGHIAPGVVDTRSIEDVHPSDLREFTQCHFFAGVGVWSLALRTAGWSDDRPVWTGSCPCQPFSQASQGIGFADERHLWPAFHHLISERNPAIVLGEQVASKDADPWIDLVHTDMEALGYAFGAVPFPSAGVGAPHIRDRLYWVADTPGARPLPGAQSRVHRGKKGAGAWHGEPQRHGTVGWLADPANDGQQRWRSGETGDGRDASRLESQRFRDAGRLANANSGQLEGLAVIRGIERYRKDSGRPEGGGESEPCGEDGWRNSDYHDEAPGGAWDHSEPEPYSRSWLSSRDVIPGPINGFWTDADWLGCTDGKFRPVEPGTFPLANGAPSRVGRLRAYGNAINAEQARVFIESVMESI